MSGDKGARQRSRRCRRGTPPPMFWQKSLQPDENKGSESEKERQEKPRVRKSLIPRDLQHRDTAQTLESCENTFAGGSKKELSGGTVSGTYLDKITASVPICQVIN